MATVRLNTNLITDWASFHQVCKEAFGFPDFYGANMDAWIDCLSYLTEDNGMTRFLLSENEMLTVEIANSENFKLRLPESFDALIDCHIFVNNRYETPKIALRFL